MSFALRASRLKPGDDANTRKERKDWMEKNGLRSPDLFWSRSAAVAGFADWAKQAPWLSARLVL